MMKIPQPLIKMLDVGRRLLWPIVVLAVVGAVLWLKLWAPQNVQTISVERGDVRHEAFGRGTIESQREAALGFDLVGRLSEVLVEEGARVTLGQELARLETNQAEAELRSARTGVTAARASLQRLAAEEEKARALLLSAEREAARTQSLFDAGTLAGQLRDEAADRLRVARAELDKVLAQRSEATRGIEVAAGGVEQKRVAMVRATLLAPFDGLVTRRLREPGDSISPGSAVLRIVDATQVYVQASMDETVLPLLAQDQPTAILFPGAASPANGKVTRISWEADRQTHELLVDIAPDKLDRRVAIGQRADVRIELAKREQVLRIPVNVIYHDDSGAYVFTDRGGRISRARPRFGVTGGDYVEVMDGLREGELVLASSRPGVALGEGRRWVAE